MIPETKGTDWDEIWKCFVYALNKAGQINLWV